LPVYSHATLLVITFGLSSLIWSTNYKLHLLLDSCF
jgi:hypothetical protein